MQPRSQRSTIYSCGLRLGEALNLEVGDIDAKRMMIHIRAGKGNRSRATPHADCGLEVSEFFAAPSVAEDLDNLSGSDEVGLGAVRDACGFLAPRVHLFAEEQPDAVQVDVGHVQPHRAAFGQLPSFVQVHSSPAAVSRQNSQPGSSHEAARQFRDGGGAPQTRDGLLDFLAGSGERGVPLGLSGFQDSPI